MTDFLEREHEQKPLTRHELEVRMTARAWKDEAFKQELLRNPKVVLEREMGRLQPGAKLPDAFEVRVLEETPNTMYLVLPRKPQIASADRELSEEDLEKVAAGCPGCTSSEECQEDAEEWVK